MVGLLLPFQAYESTCQHKKDLHNAIRRASLHKTNPDRQLAEKVHKLQPRPLASPPGITTTRLTQEMVEELRGLVGEVRRVYSTDEDMDVLDGALEQWFSARRQVVVSWLMDMGAKRELREEAEEVLRDEPREAWLVD